MKTVISTLLVIALLATAIIGIAIATGSYNFAADEPHWSVTEKIIGTARHRSIDLRAKHIPVPNDLDDPQRIGRGAEHYQAMCVGCHLARESRRANCVKACIRNRQHWRNTGFMIRKAPIGSSSTASK